METQSSPEQGNGQWQVADPRSGVRQTWMGILSCHTFTCVPVGKFPKLSELQSLYLNNGLCCGCCSFVQSCSTLCNPMDFSTPGFPVHHQLLELTQTHVYRVGDAIQPSHPCRSLLLLPPIPPSIRVFSNESTLRMRWPKYWRFSFSISPSSERSFVFKLNWLVIWGFRGSASGKEPTCQGRRHTRCGFDHRVNLQEDPLEEGMAPPSSVLAWRIPRDRGAWCATVHRVAKSRMQLK